MPSLDKNFLKQLLDDYRNFPCSIETGTYNGDTIFAMESFFQKLHTIEFSEKYYTDTKNRYTGNKIEFIQGDSSLIFTDLLPRISEKSIFFLDAHWSGGDTGRSEKDCPLLEKITLIHKLYLNDAIIIIDDFRLFGTRINEDWSTIHKKNLIDVLSSRIIKTYHLDSTCAKNDRWIIHIHKK